MRTVETIWTGFLRQYSGTCHDAAVTSVIPGAAQKAEAAGIHMIHT